MKLIYWQILPNFVQKYPGPGLRAGYFQAFLEFGNETPQLLVVQKNPKLISFCARCMTQNQEFLLSYQFEDYINLAPYLFKVIKNGIEFQVLKY
ncbi:unnamed protein product [Paramecium sonneborni]|uniref:Uncharacterized protein n=1 Tax=Paramecium sonneborni TaxID=65129 RepID=A0A8S1NVK2_9CILI|nr:unnamed protein product [Paramecium sonneborni]